jgi:flagellar motor protein MotB
MLASLEKSLMDRGIRISIDRQAGILRLSDQAVTFEKGKADLPAKAQENIRHLAEALRHVLPCYAAGIPQSGCVGASPILETVLIEGHTDSQPFQGMSDAQSAAMNDELSTRRALAVFQLLRQFQPPLDTLRNGGDLPLIGVSGYGERRPLADATGTLRGDFDRNRRIDVRFVLTSRTSAELEDLQRKIRSILDEKP